MRPRFEYGDSVRLTRNVRNDGTYPGMEVGELLLTRGATGVVYDVGTYLQDQLIYRVHFLDKDKTVGCREEELIPADAPWVQNKFEFRDKVQVRCTLKMDGEVIASAGDVGEVENVLRDGDGGSDIYYNIFINGQAIEIPEVALQAAEPEEQRDEPQH